MKFKKKKKQSILYELWEIGAACAKCMDSCKMMCLHIAISGWIHTYAPKWLCAQIGTMAVLTPV